MKISDLLFEFIRREIIPSVSKESSFTGALLNGALRAGRKKINVTLNSPILTGLGLISEDGEVDAETAAEFIRGMFEGRETVVVPVAEVVKMATGLESESPLLKGELTLTRSDAEKLIALLHQ